MEPIIVSMSVEKLKQYPNNPKKHSKEQIQKIAKSIQEFGFVQPLVITKEGEVIIGHGRLQAALSLGMKEVPVVQVDYLSPEQIRALRIADNRTHMDTLWDMSNLTGEINALLKEKYNLTVLGFNQDEITAILRGDSVTEYDRRKMWMDTNMPEFFSEDIGPMRTIMIHFASVPDVEAFANLIGQNITRDTKSLWYPRAIKDEVKNLRVVADDAEK